MTGTWTVEHARIPELVIRGRRLGRHVRHDSRSRRYQFRRSAAAPLVSVLHARNIPVLDQGDTSSCTGNAETGALGTDPLYGALPAGTALTEGTALALYSAAETIDGDGPYPPNDYGSTGLSVCQAAKNAGLISGYVHCLSLQDFLGALQEGPVILGANWYDSFDSPGSSGELVISSAAQVRGGHETLWRGIDVAAQTVFGDNSWGTGWGLGGSMIMGWGTLERLLAEQGDGTVSVPLGQPAPVPQGT